MYANSLNQTLDSLFISCRKATLPSKPKPHCHPSQSHIAILTCRVKMIKENDERTNFYTGLPSWSIFQEIFNFLSPHVAPSCSLPLEDELVMVLMRLRLGLLDVCTIWCYSIIHFKVLSKVVGGNSIFLSNGP